MGATAGGRAPRGRRQRPDTLAAPTAARSAPRHCHVCAHRGPGGVRRQRVGRGSACRPWRVCAGSRRYQWGWQWGWRLCVGAPGSARESLFRDAVPPPAVRGGGEVPCTFYASFWQFCRALQDAGSGCAAMPGETGLRCLPHWSAARRRLRSRVPSFRPRCHSSTCNRLSCRAAASSCDTPATKHATLLHLGACRPSAWPSRPRLNRRRRWLPPQTLAAREQWLSSHTAARGCTHTQQGLPGTCWLSARAAAQHLGGTCAAWCGILPPRTCTARASSKLSHSAAVAPPIQSTSAQLHPTLSPCVAHSKPAADHTRAAPAAPRLLL